MIYGLQSATKLYTYAQSNGCEYCVYGSCFNAPI